MITAVTRLYRDMGSGAVRIGLAVSRLEVIKGDPVWL